MTTSGEPLRILHVIPSLSPGRGGPTEAALNMARALARAGAVVDIATTDDDLEGRVSVVAEPRPEGDGVTLRYFPRQLRFYTVSLPLAVWLARSVPRYDVVHIHAVFSFPSTAAGVSAALRGVPYIFRPLGTLERYGMTHNRPAVKAASFNLLDRPILNRAAAIHFTSAREAQEATTLGLRSESVVLPLGVDVEALADAPPPTVLTGRFPQLEGKRPILFLSRISPKKRLDLLLEGFARIAPGFPELSLLVAGDGPPADVAALQAQASALGIADRVVWAGHLVGPVKLAALHYSRLFVLPSESENFGVAAVEALAAGLPVVVSDRVGVAPDVAKYDAGRVIKPDAADLAAAMTGLLSSESEDRMRANACRLARKRYSLDGMASELIALYRRVQRPHHRAPRIG